jgi:uncharacterized membrane protein
MFIYILVIALLIMAFIALVVLIAGCLLGAFFGGIIGAICDCSQAPANQKELAAYRGIAWGGCLGTMAGLMLALIGLIVTWVSINS